jgi:hypothetical protein
MDFLFWADGSQSAYQLASLTLLFALAIGGVASVVSPRLNAWFSTRNGTLGYLAVVLLALLGARWPTFFVWEPLNQDEAQMLAQAITALQHPIPWVDFDGTTSGPFNTYVLMLPALLGLHLSFFSTRVIAMLLEFGAIAALYVATLLRFDAALARVAVLPPLFLFSLLTQNELVHYSSERLSIFLGSLAVALLCLAVRDGFGRGWYFGIGLIGGTMPLAKLQSGPLAAGIALVAFGVVLASPQLDARRKAARAGELIGGLLLVPALTLGIVAAAGGLRDFWISYVRMGLAYILFAYEPPSFLLTTAEVGPLVDVLLATTLLGGVALAAGWKRIAPATRNAFAASLVVLAAAIYTVYSPRHGTVHYVLFAVLPAAAAAAVALALIRRAFLEDEVTGVKPGIVASALVLASLIATAAFARPPYPYLGSVYDYYFGPHDPLSGLMQQYLRPGDRLAIWGWRAKYYVDTYTLLGTRDSIAQYDVSRDFNPFLDYFRARYIGDFQKNRPLGFLDAGDESFAFGGTGFGYEMFPELAEIVKRDYRLVGTVRGMRFFVRRDAGGAR